jgi:hypothetical protein
MYPELEAPGVRPSFIDVGLTRRSEIRHPPSVRRQAVRHCRVDPERGHIRWVSHDLASDDP